MRPFPASYLPGQYGPFTVLGDPCHEVNALEYRSSAHVVKAVFGYLANHAMFGELVAEVPETEVF